MVGRALLAGWPWWVRRLKLSDFGQLAVAIERYRPLIGTTLDHGLSDARNEAINAHLSTIAYSSYVFHSLGDPISMAILTRRGPFPSLSDRTA